jgi:hypothetical protein
MTQAGDGITIPVSVLDQATAELRSIAQEEMKLAQATQGAGNVAEQAGRKAESRSQKLSRLQQELVELHRAEMRHEDALRRGVQMDERAQQASMRRQHQIDRLGRVVANENEVQRRANETVRQSGQAFNQATPATGVFGRGIAAVGTQVQGLVGGMLGAAGLIAALRLARQEMEENARAASELKKAQLDLQFLNQGFNAAELDAVRQFSEKTGRDQSEVATAFAELKSKTAGLTDEERLDAFRQIAETSLTTSGSLTPLVNAFAFGLPTVPNAEALQNLLRGVQREAGVSSTEEVAQLFLATGRETGLTPAESGGIFSFATTKVPDAARARTQARNILLRLQGDQTPESEAILSQAGATPDVGVMEQLRRLNAAQQRGELGAKEITQLFGTENFVLGSQLIGGIGEVEQTIGRINTDVTGGEDLTREAIQNIFAGDEQQRLRLQAAQIDQQIKNQRAGDANAQRVAVARKLLERELRSQGAAPARIAIQLAAFDAAAGTGRSAESALQFGFAADPRPVGGDATADMEARTRAFRDLGAGPDLDTSTIGAEPSPEDDATPQPPAPDDATPQPPAAPPPSAGEPQASAGTVINNTTNITTQFNAGSDGTTPFTGSTGRGGRAA